MNKRTCLIAAIVGAVCLVLLVLVPAGMYYGIYNHLVSLDEQVKGSWGQVQTVLQRRYDLIPNLVNTVKGYAKQEKGVLTEVTRLRSQWGAAHTVSQQAQAANALEGALGRLMVVVERYPDLKSNQNFMALQDELSGTENRVAVERRRYNEAVQAYNTAIRRFPDNFVANMSGFKPHVYFKAQPGASQAPKVQF